MAATNETLLGEQGKRRLPITETVVLAAAPVAGSAIAFAYESGFLEWYGIPPWMIRLEVAHILLASGAVALAVLGYFNFLRLVPRRPWQILFYLAAGPVLCGFLVYLIAIRTVWTWGKHLIFPAIWCGAFGLLSVSIAWSYVLAPIWRFRSEGNVWDRWAAQARKLANGSTNTSIADHLENRSAELLGFRLFLVFMIGPISVLGLKWLGTRDAQRQREFLLIHGEEPCIVVRRYADNLVCVDVDTIAKATQERFQLIATSGVSLKMEIVRWPKLANPRDTIGTGPLYRPVLPKHPDGSPTMPAVSK